MISYRAAVALLIGSVLSTDPRREQFETFINKYGREYQTLEEKERRFEIFQTNVEKYELENSKQQNSTFGISAFADLTQDEFVERHCSGVVLPKSGVPTALIVHRLSALQAPSSWDWEQHGAVTGVKNQGNCGSCWSFSTTGALEGAFQIKSGRLVSLSEEELINCKQNNGCHGGFPSDAFNWVMNNGLSSESDYPYDAQDGQQCLKNRYTPALQPGVVTGYASVQRDERAMMDAVAQQPVSVLLYAGQWNGYRSGIFSAQQCRPFSGYHAVLMVGYAPGYWRIKNSWGSDWFGEGGYIRLQRGVGGTGTCDVLNTGTYPLIGDAPGPSPTPTPTPAPSSCEDRSEDCYAWASYGYCSQGSEYYQYMSNNCKKSCGFCYETDVLTV